MQRLDGLPNAYEVHNGEGLAVRSTAKELRGIMSENLVRGAGLPQLGMQLQRLVHGKVLMEKIGLRYK